MAEPEALTRYSTHDWVEQSGSQGVEFLNWMAMRGALTGRVGELSRNYHIPISNTAAATVVYENGTEVITAVFPSLPPAGATRSGSRSVSVPGLSDAMATHRFRAV